jgi:NADH-quinone oxidoreductase subunit H
VGARVVRTVAPIDAVASVATVAVVLAVWPVIPLGPGGLHLLDLETSALYVAAIGALVPFPLIIAGWNRGGAEVDAVHAIAEIIGCRILQLLALLVVVMLSGTLSLQGIIQAQSVPYILSVPLAALLFFLAGASPVTRVPWGWAETLSSFTMCVLFSILFLGGWRGPWLLQVPGLGGAWLCLKALLAFGILRLFRAGTPSLRIDQFLPLNWKSLVPLGLIVLLAVALVEKGMVTLGVTSIHWRSAGLFATNAAIGLGIAAVLTGIERSGQPTHAARPLEGR